jgi:hypothetical protein
MIEVVLMRAKREGVNERERERGREK